MCLGEVHAVTLAGTTSSAKTSLCRTGLSQALFLTPQAVLFSSPPSPQLPLQSKSHWTQISSRDLSLNTQTPPLLPSSKHLFGDCDKNLVAHRVTSPASSATIPALDFTSFTTDYQPSWSSTPLTQAASASVNDQTFDQDFQLFNSPRTATVNRPSRGQAIHRIAPNSTPHIASRHLNPVSQRPSQQSTIGYPNSPNNYRSLTNPNAQLQHYQRIIARQNLNKVRPPVPKFHDQTPLTRHRHSAPGSSQALNTMSMFDNLDFQGGYHPDSSLDFLDTHSFGNAVTESPLQSHPATVSPTELWNDEAIMSAPPSAAFPNFATPESEFLDSPNFTSSGLNTTPMLEGVLDSDLDMTKLENMPTLFPDAQFDQFDSQPAIVPNNSFGSLSELSGTAPQASPMVRQKSSPGRPPIVHDRKASLSAGIAKANQKARKDLPEITIDSDDDKETAKRKKNTAAARKSRQRKQETMGAMSAEITRLRAIIEALGHDPDMDAFAP